MICLVKDYAKLLGIIDGYSILLTLDLEPQEYALNLKKILAFMVSWCSLRILPEGSRKGGGESLLKADTN